MPRAHILYQIKKLKDYLAFKTEMVNHRDIIKDVAAGVDRSWVYYLMLLMAGLIALMGLLTNSVAVVIGAMLISPLMGPIISSSLALTISDLHFARRAFRIIAVSVVLTVVVCALVTLISPLKEPTSEIMARVRPNIYDLFIAMLSGIAGAVALCTKRNYLITATGVAVATAVVPPLSVVGYGVGTGQLMLALGGFLLFFTNFVAIVLTSYLVFFVMGFRSSHFETGQYSPRKRLLIITALLAVISIPLVYTLVVDIKKVNTKKRIEQVLRKNLNKEGVSHLTGYTQQSRKGILVINVTVNTVSFIGKQDKEEMEKELKKNLPTPVDLILEQVIVALDKLPEQEVPAPSLLEAAMPTPRPDTAAEISAKVGRLITLTEKELKAAFAPFPLTDVRLSFGGGAAPLKVSANLQRDYPVGDDERLVIARLLQRTLELPVSLAVVESPLLPALEFSEGGSLSGDTIKALAIIEKLPVGAGEFRFLLESDRKNGKKLASFKKYLTEELKVPEESISSFRTSGKTAGHNGIKLRILRHREIQ